MTFADSAQLNGFGILTKEPGFINSTDGTRAMDALPDAWTRSLLANSTACNEGRPPYNNEFGIHQTESRLFPLSPDSLRY